MAEMMAQIGVLMMVVRMGFEKICSRIAMTVVTRDFEKVLRKGYRNARLMVGSKEGCEEGSLDGCKDGLRQRTLRRFPRRNE